MKWISIILCVYFGILLCIPCHDINHFISFEHDEIASSNTSQSDNDHHDYCSPLCVCACCGVILSYAPYTHYDITNTSKVIAKVKTLPLTINITSQYLESIWQPPKAIA